MKTPSKIKLPKIGELAALLKQLKKEISDDYRIDGQEDDTPTMCVTVGCDIETGEWGFQTGDNSFSGGAYGYQHWGVGYLTRRSNSRDVANDIIGDIANQVY
jgi:hypothetical protein